MKYAGGCFGCLALIFFGLTIVFQFGATFIVSSLVAVDPNLATTVSPLLGTLNWINSGCCCISSLLAIVLLAVGFSKNDAVE